LIEEARQHHLCLVTTEKDLLRLKGDAPAAALAAEAKALPVSMVVEDKEAFRTLVLQRLKR
jgi:tetraacyldisaccharide 4'-kinase